MDYDPINWYPEQVPMGMQTPTVYVPPSSAPYYPPTTVPYYPPTAPYYPPSPALYYPPLTSSPSTFPQNQNQEIVIPAALQDCLSTMQQAFTAFNNEFTSGIQKIQDKLRERGVMLSRLKDSLPKYAPEDPTLPRPWKCLIDGSTGSLYYWNTESNKTQYERPCNQASQCQVTPTGLSAPPTIVLEQPEVNPASLKATTDHTVVISGTTTGAALASGSELDHNLVRGNAQSILKVPINDKAIDDAQLLQKTSDTTAEPAQLSVVTPVDITTSDSTTFHKFPPQPGGASSMKLRSFATPISGFKESVEPHPSSVVPTAVSLLPVSLDSVVLSGTSSEANIDVGAVDKRNCVHLSMGVRTGKIEYEFHNIDTVVVVNNSDLGAQAVLSRSNGSVVKLNTTEAFQEHSESVGILKDEDDLCPASTIVQQRAMNDAVCQKKFSLLHPFCNLGNFDGAINCSFTSILIYGTQGFFTADAGECNLSIVGRCENEQVSSVMVLEKIWDVELASAGNGMELDSRVRKGVRPAQAIVMCSVDTPSQAKLWQQLIRCFALCHCETKSSFNYRGATFDEMGLMSHTSLSQVADSLFDDLSTTEIKIAHFRVAICVASHSDSIDVALLGSSEKVFKWTNKRKRATFLSLMDTFLSRLFRMETHETTQTIICRWLLCFLLPCDCQKKAPLLTGTLNTWFDAKILCLPLENNLVKLSVPLLDELENTVYNHFSSQGVVHLLGVVSVLTKSDPNVSLLADLQGIQNAEIFTTLQITFLLCQVTLTCMAFHDGCFVWYAYLVYQRFDGNISIWKRMCELHKSICWDLMTIRTITLKQVGAVTCWQPSMRDCCIDIDQTTAFFQSRCFSIAAVMCFLQTNSSSRYSYGLVFLMITKASYYLLHLVYLAALLWTLKHNCGISKSTSFFQLPNFTLVPQSFPLENVLDRLLAVACENSRSFCIWFPTTMFSLEVWALTGHILILIGAQRLLGDALLKGVLVCANACCMIPIEVNPSEARVCHFGEDLQLTYLYSHLGQFNMCGRQTKVHLLDHTHICPYIQVACDYGLPSIVSNVSDKFHIIDPTWWHLLLLSFAIPHVKVWSGYWEQSTNGILQVNSEFLSLRYFAAPISLMSAGDTHSGFHIIFQKWLFLIHIHERDLAMSTVHPNSPYFTWSTRLFHMQYILRQLLGVVLGVFFVVLGSITATKLLKFKKEELVVNSCAVIFYVVYVFNMHMQIAENLFPSQIVESLEHDMPEFEVADSTWGCTEDNTTMQLMLLLPRDECKVNGLLILPLLYKLVIGRAVQRTWELHILRDYASNKSIIVILIAVASCFADQPKLVQGISKTKVFCGEHVTEYALSIHQQVAAQVILFHLYGEEYQMLFTGSHLATPTYKLCTPAAVTKHVIESDVMLIAEETWDAILDVHAVRHEDMPYFKGGGMLGLLYDTLITWMCCMSIYLDGLLIGLESGHIESRYLGLVGECTI